MTDKDEAYRGLYSGLDDERQRIYQRVDSSKMRVKGLFVASPEMRACGAPT